MSSLDQNVLPAIIEHNQQLMQLINACPQMTPHIEAKEESDWLKEINECLPEFFSLYINDTIIM